MSDERRKFVRLPASFAVECQIPDATGAETRVAYSRNVSVGGLGVVLSERHPVGTELELTFRLPTGERVHACGRIAWVDEFTVGRDKAFDTGIEFVDIGAGDAERLELRIGP